MLLLAPFTNALGSWTTKKGPPVALYDSYQSCAAHGADYYLYAGRAYQQPEYVGAMMKYTTTVDAWSIGTPAIAFVTHRSDLDRPTIVWSVNRSPLQTGVSHLATGSYGGFIYTLDGYESPLNDLPSTQKYSTLTDTWTSVHRIPTARAKGPSGAGMAAVAATVGSRIFVIGGTAGKTTSQKTVEVYSPGTDSWETKKSLPIATGDAFVGVVADKSLANMTIIVGGGGSSSSLSDILAHVHRYDANSDDWITGMPFPSEFSRLGGTITRTCLQSMPCPLGYSPPQPLRPCTACFSTSAEAWMPIPSPLKTA